MAQRQLENIFRDADLAHEVIRRLPDAAADFMAVEAIVVGPGETTPEVRDFTAMPAPTEGQEPKIEGSTLAEPLLEPVVRISDAAAKEAIVRRFGRPSLLVRNDTFEVPPADTWKARLYPSKARLDRAIRSVGRIEIPPLGIPHVGTAWMLTDDLAITNRHVALTFAAASGTGRFGFLTTPIGQSLAGRVDFRAEAAQTAPFEVDIVEIVYVSEATDDAPDIALLRLGSPTGVPLPPPIELSSAELKLGQVIAAIGYPAQDPRNPAADQARIFGGLFDIKRLAPGEITGFFDGDLLSHDATTLGGSSGSVIVDVASGQAVGLHFAGVYETANYALSANSIREVMRTVRRPIKVRRAKADEAPPKDVGVGPAKLAGRRGYRADFLGRGAPAVPLPTLNDGLAALATTVDGGRGNPGRFVLKYEHFSLVMHRQRKLAIFAAVNIDGAEAVQLKRTRDVWNKDLRIGLDAQTGNELYHHNDLDRGHLVRRLDPAWGRTAKRAEEDTFFYTNSTPQHATFNQTLWVGLEDYLLEHADTLNFRACVLSGPVFAENDPQYRGVHLPGSYWKVAAMLRAGDRVLSATAYLVSQSDLITGLEFVYGQYKTYQVPIAQIETLAGLDFGPLRKADPLGRTESAVPREVLSVDDVVLR